MYLQSGLCVSLAINLMVSESHVRRALVIVLLFVEEWSPFEASEESVQAASDIG